MKHNFFDTVIAGKTSFLLLLPLLILFLLAVFSQPYHVYDYYFNPDALYLATLYESLIVQGYPLITHYLNPSLLLIPDLLIFFIARYFSGDVIISSFLFSIIQHTLIFSGIFLIFKYSQVQKYWSLAAFSGAFFMLFFMGAVFSHDFIFAAFSLVSTNHTGAFAMALFAVATLLKYFSKPSKQIILLLGLIVFFSVLSDRLFLLMFVAPATAVIVFEMLVLKSKKKLTL